MRIISDFKDYYDSVRRMDTDRNHVYVRKTSEIYLHKYVYNLENNFFSKLNRQTSLRDSTSLHMFHLGFCGEIYTGWQVHKCICGKTSEAIHYGDLKRIKQLYEKYEKPFSWKPGKYKIGEYCVKRLTECFESSNINKFKELFLKYKVPVFVITTDFTDDKYRYGHDQKIILNPKLEDWKFFRIKDIYTAYQDISMYIGNELAEDKNNAWPVPDKLKAESHGFDKYSFRKEKQL